MTAATERDLRTSLRLTQEQLAHEIGVTVGTINRWEKAKAAPSHLAARALRDIASRMAVVPGLDLPT